MFIVVFDRICFSNTGTQFIRTRIVKYNLLWSTVYTLYLFQCYEKNYIFFNVHILKQWFIVVHDRFCFSNTETQYTRKELLNVYCYETLLKYCTCFGVQKITNYVFNLYYLKQWFTVVLDIICFSNTGTQFQFTLNFIGNSRDLIQLK